ncbi:homocysteine S-methyltransferase family protein [Nostoc sp. NIES-2111]
MSAAPGHTAKFRSALPQRDGDLFITDGGLETTLVFLEGVELPVFAAFPLVLTKEGQGHLRRYFAPYLEAARQHGKGFILDTPTWRANRDWGAQIGYGPEDLAEVNRKSVEFIRELRDESGVERVVLDGVIGPRGDGYAIETKMSPQEAADYHDEQVRAFSGTAADMVTALTMTYAEEATGLRSQPGGMACLSRFPSRWRRTDVFLQARVWRTRLPNPKTRRRATPPPT